MHLPCLPVNVVMLVRWIMGYRKVSYFEQLLYIIENLIERRIRFIMTGSMYGKEADKT